MRQPGPSRTDHAATEHRAAGFGTVESTAMAKDMSKGEKLDLILSELSALKGEVKKLAKQQDFLINQIKALQSRPSNTREVKQPAKKTSKSARGKASPRRARGQSPSRQRPNQTLKPHSFTVPLPKRPALNRRSEDSLPKIHMAPQFPQSRSYGELDQQALS